MTKEKQIEEMERDLIDSVEHETLFDVDFYTTSKNLIAKGYRKVEQGECPYCKDRTVTELPLKTNCDMSRVGVLIAQGDKKKEIVFWTHDGTYGIEINYCPICGAKMKGE